MLHHVGLLSIAILAPVLAGQAEMSVRHGYVRFAESRDASESSHELDDGAVLSWLLACPEEQGRSLLQSLVSQRPELLHPLLLIRHFPQRAGG